MTIKDIFKKATDIALEKDVQGSKYTVIDATAGVIHKELESAMLKEFGPATKVLVHQSLEDDERRASKCTIIENNDTGLQLRIDWDIRFYSPNSGAWPQIYKLKSVTLTGDLSYDITLSEAFKLSLEGQLRAAEELAADIDKDAEFILAALDNLKNKVTKREQLGTLSPFNSEFNIYMRRYHRAAAAKAFVEKYKGVK